MKVETILLALFFVKHNLNVREINFADKYIRFINTGRDTYYSIKKLTMNYDKIIKGEEPLYYKELY